jgi:hypothetical protein
MNLRRQFYNLQSHKKYQTKKDVDLCEELNDLLKNLHVGDKKWELQYYIMTGLAPHHLKLYT